MKFCKIINQNMKSSKSNIDWQLIECFRNFLQQSDQIIFYPLVPEGSAAGHNNNNNSFSTSFLSTVASFDILHQLQ